MQITEIKTVCSLGTGMGANIALVFAMAGYNVRMFGRSYTSIHRGMSTIHTALDIFLHSELITEEDVPCILNRITGVTTLEEAAQDADFIIESVAEHLLIKQEVFLQLEKICRPDTIFATNTSGLSPSAIAGVLEHKGRFVVAHFWNPPHLMPLVEIVPGVHTTRATADLTYALMEKIGKKPVQLQCEALGFIGNRLQIALLREAFHIVESGIASKEAVDTTVKYSLGRRLSITGPFESADLGGLDIFYSIFSYLLPDLCSSTVMPSLLEQMVEQKNLGAKTGKGLYNWTPENLAKVKNYREKRLVELLKKDSATHTPPADSGKG